MRHRPKKKAKKAKPALSSGLRSAIALIAFYAWIGLGSDGLSSVNYGPEEAFRALGQYPMLGLYLALAIMFTVFVIAGSYNQVIELFPTGGGGYRVANELLHPAAGLVSGVALLVDYVLTISISVAAAVDALFSLLPNSWWHYRLVWKIVLIIALMLLNLRGMKESIKFMMPIFLGFVLTHLAIIMMGLIAHEKQIPAMFHAVITQSHSAIHTMGWAAAALLLVKAYSLGAGTYTGLEAVSNNVNVLAEPRVRTGKWTMFYMAASLSIMAGGVTIMYMLWHISPHTSRTYNATLFNEILANIPHHHIYVLILMAFEAGILMLGANTGFLGGPAVLANMAIDKWVPTQFGNLSSRLVKQNGIIAMAIIALLIMLATDGHVSTLVILYSTTVFLTFSISLFGLVRYWLTNKKNHKTTRWLRKLTIASLGFFICAFILVVIVSEKFMAGGWLTLVIMGLLITLFYYIRQHYQRFSKKMKHVDHLLTLKALNIPDTTPELQPEAQTAVIFVNEHTGLGIHTLLWINRLFPDQFKNYIFIEVGQVDNQSFSGEQALNNMQNAVSKNLNYFVQYAHSLGAAAGSYASYGMNKTEELLRLGLHVAEKYPKAIFFSSRVILTHSGALTSLLHNKTANQLQAKLHSKGRQMILLPMNIPM